MNISKFVFIDAVLIITAIPLLFLIKGGKKKYPILQGSDQEKMLGKASLKIPDKVKILELEQIAKLQGSGIDLDSLVGRWLFISVWKKDTNEDDSLFSSLLRAFSAKLELEKDISIEDPLKLSISTSIQFGIFSIEFSGYGYLKGEQPFLPFFFNLIEFKSRSRLLFSRSLEEPLEEEKSFFALIASGENGRWLSARGQSGSLILWMKD
tara:strand:- start:8087 stop:8713 length:627 start_codon:yes stop_codon:yes gene_type:complete